MNVDQHHIRVRPQSVATQRGVVLALLLIVICLLMSPFAFAQDETAFGTPVEGQRIYDQAGVFSASERAELEAAAAEVEQSGSPVVVFYRQHDADYDETVQDGRDLMDAWDIQSAPGARDGVVMFVNAEEDDPRHGEFAIVAGESLIEGNLPQYELDRIANEMLDLLRDEQTADAIGLGLREITRDLTVGPPPPPQPNAFERFATDVTDSPFSIVNIISVFLAVPVLAWISRQFSRRERPKPRLLTDAPTDLPPAQAGALATGTVGDAQLLGTIIDLAGRGALVIEPEDSKGKKARARLLDGSLARGEVEERVWQSLTEQADADGTISSKRLGKVRGGWGSAKETLERDLRTRGWFDPTAGTRRTPLYILGGMLLVVAIVPFVLMATAEQLWALIGTLLLAGAALLAFAAAISIPNTTVEGDIAAEPWRSYQHTLKQSRKHQPGFLDLDRDLPYAVAMGAASSLDKQLKTASKDGYVPAWLTGNGNLGDSSQSVAFYPVWIAFSGSMTPTASGVSSSTGASSGSGSAGGSF